VVYYVDLTEHPEAAQGWVDGTRHVVATVGHDAFACRSSEDASTVTPEHSITVNASTTVLTWVTQALVIV
jgi:hypothetical protein